jgi:glucan 1,3-beta-glucosidase
MPFRYIFSLNLIEFAQLMPIQDWFFWTWKIGPSIRTKKVESPQWSYQLGLQNDWMPKDPREAIGKCGGKSPWQPPLQPWQTGGVGAGNIPPTMTVQYPWPPATISLGGVGSELPQYTPTGVVPTLPGPTFSFASATATPSPGNGWANAADTAGSMVEKQGCQYLDPWIGVADPPPVCTV